MQKVSYRKDNIAAPSKKKSSSRRKPVTAGPTRKLRLAVKGEENMAKSKSSKLVSPQPQRSSVGGRTIRRRNAIRRSTGSSRIARASKKGSVGQKIDWKNFPKNYLLTKDKVNYIWKGQMPANVTGMLAGNAIGGGITYLLRMLGRGLNLNFLTPAANDAAGLAWLKFLSASTTGVLSYFLFPPVGGEQTKVMRFLGQMGHGAVELSTFAAFMNLIKSFFPQVSTNFVGDLTGLSANALVSGPHGNTVGAIFTADDLQAKLSNLEGEAAQLDEVTRNIDVSLLSDSEDAVYLAALEHLAALRGPVDAARRFLDRNMMAEATDAAKEAFHLLDVARALLAGLTAEAPAAPAAPLDVQLQTAMQQQFPAMAQQLPALTQQMPALAQQFPALAQQLPALAQMQMQMPATAPQLTTTVEIQDAGTGQVESFPAPGVEAVMGWNTNGTTVNLDALQPWAGWVGSLRPQWAPSEVTTAYVAKHLANNMSVGGGLGSGLNLVVGGQSYPCGIDTNEIQATISGIFEHHFGLY